MKFFSYIFREKKLIVPIILLLVIECATGIAIPFNVAKFIDYGIKQTGIENSSPDEVGSNMYELFLRVADEDDKEFVSKHYTYDEDSNTYKINKPISIVDRKRLDDISSDFYAFIYYLYENNYQRLSNLMYTDINNIDDTTINEFKSEVYEYVGNLNDSQKKEYAINATKKEYYYIGYEDILIVLKYLNTELPIVAILLILFISSGIAGLYLTSKLVTNISKKLRSKCVSTILMMDKDKVSSISESSILTRITNDVQNILNTGYDFIRLFILSLISTIICVFYCFVYPFQLNVILITMLLIIFILSIVLCIKIMPRFAKMQESIDNVNLASKETITGAEYLKSINLFNKEKEKFDVVNKNLYCIQIRSYIPLQLCIPIVSLIIDVGILIVYYVGAITIIDGLVSVGRLLAYISFLNILIGSFVQIASFLLNFTRANVSVKRVDEIINNSGLHKINDVENNSSIKETNIAKYEFPEDIIKFNNVSISDRVHKNNILNDVSFSIKKNKNNFIVGAMSSGKTTIINLLLSFIDQNSGDIIFLDNNIKSLTKDEILDKFSYVPQKNVLFNSTLKENITLCSQNIIDDNKIYDVLKTTQMYDFVMDRDEKLNYKIVQRAKNISGGQMQRLCIARALICDKPIVVMDDCFTALDAKTSSAILNSIKEKYPNTTFIMTTNRFDNIKNDDNIIVIKDQTCIYSGYLENIKSKLV